MFKIIAIVLFLFSSLSFCSDYLIEQRRKSQFLNEPGYLVMPAPYSLPGIGKGVAYYGGFNNYLGYSDIFAAKVDGEVNGYFIGLWDLHLIKELLFFDLTFHEMNKLLITNYSGRGMETRKNDYSVMEFGSFNGYSLKSVLSFFDRRLEFIAKYDKHESRLSKLRDNRGNLISSVMDGRGKKNYTIDFSILLDMTDDRQDPLKGFRAEIEVGKSSHDSAFDPEFYTLNSNLSGYIPVGEKSTLALNFFRSDAVIINEGETDKLKIAESLGFAGCQNGCAESITDVINNTYMENRVGSARALGGDDRLRSYPSSRFRGAHSQMVGAEFRWNLTAEREPFNLYFMKDIRTGVQIAFFHEIGSVADNIDSLWEKSRSSSGAGTRFIMGSGFVYRFDYANGDEGDELSVIVTYPWEGFMQ